MNKKLITLAVAAAMVAPLAAVAETTLYGRLDNALTWWDLDIKQDRAGNKLDRADRIDEQAWDTTTGTTRIGVKGSEDLGNGLKAIFQAEWAFNSTEGGSTDDGGGDGNLKNRLGYVGLAGGFGTVAIGRQWTPYYGAVNKTDVFNNPASEASANGNYLGLTRVGNAVAYASPNFGGFTVKTALIIDGETGLGDSDGVDAWNPSIEYNNGPISIGASYLGYDDDIVAGNGDEPEDRWGISGSYNFGMFKLIAQYEDRDETENDITGDLDNETDAWTLLGEAYLGNNILRAQYGQVDNDAFDDELDVWAIGIQHNFSKATRVYAEYYSNSHDDNDISELALGLRHDF